MEDQHQKELEEIGKELKELGDLVTQAKTVAQKLEFLAAKRERELMQRVKRIEIFHYFRGQ